MFSATLTAAKPAAAVVAARGPVVGKAHRSVIARAEPAKAGKGEAKQQQQEEAREQLPCQEMAKSKCVHPTRPKSEACKDCPRR
eukprot:CAMPEP_0182852430 /NCGR_PEP_ID=MMETSP0034_2-20130328/159_1 /TAXON_ID=156128 /ORGANISM="Nephroselmis pyriformis, Strain CCMP717" /LENGTH=83 /DNA_ID=CAMNT_0024983139 /DNA_START=10 /DNA_END=261 /DNA_ORIENTATION=-